LKQTMIRIGLATTRNEYLGILAAVLLSVATSSAAAGDDRTAPFRRPAHTYSIVARDPKTGELGVAVQSHWSRSVRWCPGPRQVSAPSPPSRSLTPATAS
jgi:hypothetical protein